jgi:L-serine dehydratase
MQWPVDIFNDVLGPVMTGPSSSHTAGPARIGHLVHDLCDGVKSAVIAYSIHGAYAATLHGQASDCGFAAGLLGFGCDDSRLPQSLSIAREHNVEILFEPIDTVFDHPNTAVIHAIGRDDREWKVKSISIGGGNIRVESINDVRVDCDGSQDIYVSLGEPIFVSTEPLGKNSRCIRQILPVEYPSDGIVQFSTVKELTALCTPFQRLSEAALAYQQGLSKWSRERIEEFVSHLLKVMEKAAIAGLQIEHSERFQWLQPTARKMSLNSSVFIPSGILNESILISTAIMEHDRDMGVIVAAPTAGSAGVIPSLLLPLMWSGEYSIEQLVKALLAAGLVGVFIQNQGTFAAEVAGCQAENGSASAMAAAALCDLTGADLQTALKAAALALSNMLGLVCDPVGGGVEIPCISRNASAAANALVSANMVLGGFDPLIPLDEVIQAMMDIGKQMHPDLLCTARGGLAGTATGKQIASNWRTDAE